MISSMGSRREPKRLPISWRRLRHGLAILTVCVTANVAIAQTDSSAEDAAASDEDSFAMQVVEIKGLYGESPYPMPVDPTALLLGGASREKSIYKLCDFLDELAGHDEIDGVFLDLSDPVLGISAVHLTELERAIERLKAADKEVVAWLEVGSTVHYSVASVCDEVYLADMGLLDLPSRAMSSLHFRDAMDLLGVKASVARVGEFKGAVEPFTNSRMSTHLRKHYLRMIESINADTVNRISRARGLTPDQVREVQSKRLFVGRAALEAGLVDALAPYGGERELVESRVGEPIEWRVRRPKPPRPFNFFEFMNKLTGGQQADTLAGPGLAVLYLSGQIIDGKSRQPGSMVSGPTVEAIEKLTADENVKGVVVRVDSPGGSATASEAIRRALVELADKKPVVISMGRVAASGGYWISSLGRPIYAEHSTITGSIGVFAMKLSFGTLMNRIGLHTENITLDDSASAFSMDRGWTEEEVAMLQEFVGDTYSRFLALVSKSRQMEPSAVDQIGGGRVWSGAQAQAIGLVDQLGGLESAMAHVRREAGLAVDCPTIERPSPPPPIDLSTLLGGDENEIRMSLHTLLAGPGGLDATILRGLKAQGFDLTAVGRIIEQSLSGQAPSVYLMSPELISIR